MEVEINPILALIALQFFIIFTGKNETNHKMKKSGCFIIYYE